MKRDQGRPVGRLVEPRFQPCGPRLAEAAAVTPGLQRVEHEDADRQILDRILDEAVRRGRLRKDPAEGLAVVVIAHRRVDREAKRPDRLAEPGIGFLVAMLDEVAGHEQKIRPGLDVLECAKGAVEPLAVQLVGNARIEAEMDVGDLGDDHRLEHPRRRGGMAGLPLFIVQPCHIARCDATGQKPAMAEAATPKAGSPAVDEAAAWSGSSWRRFEARQQPDYPDPAALAAATRELAAYPPLVPFREVDALRAAIARAQRGEAFLLQGGDCAESFAEFSGGNIDANVALLEAMADRIAAAGIPVIRIGRMAGQFAKPRSADTEIRGDIALPAYRGDIVNGIAFESAARRPDPDRMFRAYAQATATLARIGGAACTSHEALLLPFEEALTRRDPETGRTYATSAHFLWIGDRTRFQGSAHVEFARGLANPIGIKCGPELDPEALLGLLETLDPAREPGRITLIARLGLGRIEAALPPLLRAVAAGGHPVLWACDPMHGNTIRTALGSKTRPLDRILGETRAFFAIAGSEGVRCGGLHFEMTGRDVAECTGGGVAPGDPDMGDRYHTHCDPRLNPAQAMALAGIAAEGLAGIAPRRDSPADGSDGLSSLGALR
jgi:3-deoxy-7-phosphoheptulonate synthase